MIPTQMGIPLRFIGFAVLLCATATAARCPWELFALEKVTLASPTEALQNGWKTIDLVRQAISIHRPNISPEDTVQVIAKPQSQSTQNHLQNSLKKALRAASAHNSPGFFERRAFLQQQSNKLKQEVLSALGVNTVATSYRGGLGGKFVNTVVDLDGPSNLNRLARVLFDRTGLLLEINESPNLQVDEKAERINIPTSHLGSRDQINKDIDSISKFIDQNQSNARVFAGKPNEWLDSTLKPVAFANLSGKRIEVSTTLDNGHELTRDLKVPYVGNVVQYVDHLSGYAERIPAASENLKQAIEHNSDVTLDKFGADIKDDFHPAMLVVDHLTGKVGNYRVLSGSQEERVAEIKKADAQIREIAARGAKASSQTDVSIIFMSSSTKVNPITPVYLRKANEMLAQWRSNAGLSKISPERVHTEMVSAWINPDGAPLTFHRPLYIFTEDGQAPL
jgi:hypothetical protein